MIISVKLAKQYIEKNGNPEGMAQESRHGIKRPVRWSGHREGGGYVIDSALLDFSIFSDQEIIKYANELNMFIGLQSKYRNMSLSDFLNQFPPK